LDWFPFVASARIETTGDNHLAGRLPDIVVNETDYLSPYLDHIELEPRVPVRGDQPGVSETVQRHQFAASIFHFESLNQRIRFLSLF
jgi:hypothetical protein